MISRRGILASGLAAILPWPWGHGVDNFRDEEDEFDDEEESSELISSSVSIWWSESAI